MKARPWLARSGSESELPCQFNEDGRKIGWVHGPPGRENEKVLIAPAAPPSLPKVCIHGPMDAVVQRNEAGFAAFGFSDQKPISCQVCQQEASDSRCI